jgi:hypothetical protein
MTGARPRDDQPDQAVGAEAVGDFDAKAKVGGLRDELAHLGLGAPDRRGVELIGAPRELRRPGYLVRAQRRDRHRQAQAGEERREIGCRVLRLLPLRFLAIERRALRVLCGRRRAVEDPDVVEQRRVLLRRGRSLDGNDLGTARPDAIANQQVVVDEHNVEADVSASDSAIRLSALSCQLIRQAARCSRRTTMSAGDRTPRPRRFVVPATRQTSTPFRLSAKRGRNAARRVDPKSVGAILAAGSAPQRVVAVVATTFRPRRAQRGSAGRRWAIAVNASGEPGARALSATGASTGTGWRASSCTAVMRWTRAGRRRGVSSA